MGLFATRTIPLSILMSREEDELSTLNGTNCHVDLMTAGEAVVSGSPILDKRTWTRSEASTRIASIRSLEKTRRPFPSTLLESRLPKEVHWAGENETKKRRTRNRNRDRIMIDLSC